MSLNYDASKVKGLDTLHTNEVESTKTAYLCFVLSVAGVNRITETNVEDVVKRVTLWERVNGAVLRNGSEPYPYTAEDIRARIGYTTNVSDIPLGKWLRIVWDGAGTAIG